MAVILRGSLYNPIPSGSNPVPISGATVTVRLASPIVPNPNPIIASTVSDSNGEWEFTDADGLVHGVQYQAYAIKDQAIVVYNGRDAIPHSFTDLQVDPNAGILLTKLDEGVLDDDRDPAAAVVNLQERLGAIISMIKDLEGALTTDWNTPFSTSLLSTLSELTRDQRGNQLVNPEFDHFQRTAGAVLLLNAGLIGPDRWYAIAQQTYQRDTSSVSKYSVTWTASTPGTNGWYQPVENWQAFKGKTVTFSCDIYAPTAANVSLRIADGVGQTDSAAGTTNNTWHRLSVTRTLDAAATGLTVYIISTSLQTMWADNATLLPGSGPGARLHHPLPPAEDFQRCLRYYEKFGGVGVYDVFGTGYTYDAVNGQIWLPFSARKGGTPTIAFSAANTFCGVSTGGGFITLSAIAASSQQPNGTVVDIQVAGGFVAGAGTMLFANNTLDASITAAWNP